METKNSPGPLTFLCAASDIRIEAEAGEGKKSPRFTMTAYTGGAMAVGGWRYPIVVDLSGLNIPLQSLPIRLQHDASRGVGHTDRIGVESGILTASGVISRATPAASDVVESSKNGFPWQASIGASVVEYEFVKEGQSVLVNGKTHSGPVNVVRKSVLGEISFVDLGADMNTSAHIAAKSNHQEGLNMADEQKQDEVKAETKADAKAETVIASDPVTDMRKAAAAESSRIAGVRAASKGNAEIEAKAIAEGWDAMRTELEVLRAERPKAPGVIIGEGDATDAKTLECAMMQSSGVSGDALVKAYGEKTVDAADKQFKGRMGPQRLLMECAQRNGSRIRFFNDDPREVLRAAFSTKDIDGILGNTANKQLLAGFDGVESVWRQITAVRNVSDFKTVTSYRMTGAFQYEKVGATGELQHAQADEESFTNKADTYGIMFAVTREDIINDDLGALTTLPRKIGRGAALKINDVFWREFATITFSGANASTGVFGIAGLTAAELKFLNKVDADRKPLAIMPSILLVPNALKTAAEQLMGSANLLATGDTDATMAAANPHAGKWRVLASSYLGNASYGNSAVKYYLLANPADGAVIETAFLYGVESPTVESADADFNVLGIQMRGYHDFGVSDADVRYGVGSSGQ